MKRLTLAGFLLRPFQTFKHARKIFKSVELVPMVRVSDTTPEAEAKVGDFIVYQNLAFPAETWKLIKPSLLKVDYTYHSGDKVWSFHRDQKIYTGVLTKDAITAMRVAKRFEEAS